jgi:predicted esterase
LGDSPHGWASFCQDLAHTLGGYVKFVLPWAPEQDVTCNGGMVMPSWMDLEEIPIHITSPDTGRHQPESIAIVHGLVDELIESGIPSERIVIGGFSQGGALALASTIKSPHKLAGCCSLSGWALPAQDLGNAVKTSASFTSPFLICHGEADQVVMAPNGPHVAQLLSDAGVKKVSLKTYPHLPHSMCPAVCVF